MTVSVTTVGYDPAIGQFIRPIHCGMIYGTDLKHAGVPMATIGLMLVNTILFFITPDEIVGWVCFLPISDLDLRHIMTTTVTRAFLHVDCGQLFGNLIFLWAFGAPLEARIGWERLICAYLLCSVISNLICPDLLIHQIQVYDEYPLILQNPSIGASAAISGLMGLFMIHCCYARFWFSRPILCKPIFSFSFRINGILLIGLFFARDLTGNMVQTPYDKVLVDYWGHVGGFLGGLMLAMAFNLQPEGIKEVREVRAERLTRTAAGTVDVSERYACNEAIILCQ